MNLLWNHIVSSPVLRNDGNSANNPLYFRGQICIDNDRVYDKYTPLFSADTQIPPNNHPKIKKYVYSAQVHNPYKPETLQNYHVYLIKLQFPLIETSSTQFNSSLLFSKSYPNSTILCESPDLPALCY